MASVQKRIVVSMVLVLVAGLAACGKPEIRSKTMDAPSPSSNPKQAEAENKTASEAAAKALLTADVATKKKHEAALAEQETRRKTAMAELAELTKREGATAAEQLADARAKVSDGDGVSPAAPGVSSEASSKSIAVTSAPLDGPSTDIQISAVLEQAARKAFTIAMIEPVMRANFQVYLTRFEVLRMKAKIDENKDLSADEATWIQKVRLEYGVDEKASFDLLLERVDAVNLPFLAAPLALRSNWSIDGEVSVDKIVKRVQELNTSSSDEKLRFRSARLAVKAGHQAESVAIMRAFLAYNGEPKVEQFEKIIETVREIVKVMNDPVYHAEVERVRLALLDEYTPKTSVASPLTQMKK